VLDELGIDKTTHGFRHYFTTRLIKTYKGDLLEVRQYTRHASLEMLQIYNDSIKQQADLPRFYSAFEGVQL
jgi:integrase/recombinase XerC